MEHSVVNFEKNFCKERNSPSCLSFTEKSIWGSLFSCAVRSALSYCLFEMKEKLILVTEENLFV